MERPIIEKGSRQSHSDTENILDASLITSAAICALSSFSFGISLTSFQSIFDVVTKCTTKETGIIKDSVLIQKSQWSSLISILCLGALASNLLVGRLNMTLKKKIHLNNVLYLTGNILILSMSNYYTLLLARALIGLASGVSCAIVPQYLSAIAPTKIKGIIASLHSMGIVLGVLAGQILAYFFKDVTNWRITFVSIVIFMVAHSVGLFFIKESGQSGGETGGTEDIGVFKLLCYKEARRSLITAVLVHMGQQLSCINGVIFYSNKILEKTDDPALYTIYVGISSIISTFFAMLVVDKFGRKIMLLSSIAICSGGLMMLALEKMTIQALFLYMVGFNIGLGPVAWFITGEIFPGQFINAACTIAVSVNWIFNFFVAQSFEMLFDLMGTKSYYIYVGSMGVLFLYVVIYFSETKGKASGFQ